MWKVYRLLSVGRLPPFIRGSRFVGHERGKLTEKDDVEKRIDEPQSLRQLPRTERTIAVLDSRSLIFLLGLIVSTIGHLWFQARFGYNNVVVDGFWSKGCILLIIFVPTLLTICTFAIPVSSKSSKIDPDVRVREVSRLLICIVTRGTNVDAVVRSVDQMRHLQQYDSRVKIFILTDEAYGDSFKGLGVHVVATPNSFRPLKAKYKARALAYYAQNMKLRDNDWVLHLDEESIVDEHTVKACIDFAEEQDEYHFGQGVILYNSFDYWRHKLITAADLVRGRDDLAKFYFAHNYLHVPVFGIHGSFLLINGRLENEVGWDTDSLVEDFWFGLQAWEKGYKLGWIRSIAREQSPMTLLDFCTQRLRWFSGMLFLPGPWGKLACFQWCISSMGHYLIFIFQCWGLHLPFWAYLFLTFCAAGERLSLMYTSVLQDIDAGLHPIAVITHALLCPLIAIFANLLDTMTILYGLLKPAKRFHVIQK